MRQGRHTNEIERRIAELNAERETRCAREKEKREARRSVLMYIADKWIDFLALLIALIALIRTF